MTSIHVKGAPELIKRIDNIRDMMRVKSAIAEAAQGLQGRIKEKPRVSRRPNWMLRGNSPRAQRMRAGFFARLKSGEIEVPYRRGASPGSERLTTRWTISMQNQGWRAVIGNNASYARLVQDSAKQTGYHRGTGWITTNQVVQLYGQDAIRTIRRALIQEVEDG